MRKTLVTILPYALIVASLLSITRSPGAHAALQLLAVALFGVWLARMKRRKMLAMPVTGLHKAIQSGGHVTYPVEWVAAALAIACDIYVSVL